MARAQQMMGAMNQPPAPRGPAPAVPVPGGPQGASPAGGGGAAGETKFCMTCGKTMPRPAKFCPECGSGQ